MKNVLVVGDTGYIGRKFCAYKLDGLHVDGISSRHNSWKEAKLEQYSCVIYAAGMAHCKQTSENRERFFQVNTALPIEIAEHAKAAGVQQFIYLSSLSVYGMRTGVIRETDIPHPREEDAYGVSKRSAEVSLLRMSSDNFHVLIVRPPMVYGPGCRGNFQKLIKLVRILPVFPRVNNARSMIYIQNLCEFPEECRTSK